jgi:G3E family GTPase
MTHHVVAFTFEDEDGNSLNEFARLDTMVTVVDAFNFLKDYGSIDSLQQLKCLLTQSPIDQSALHQLNVSPQPISLLVKYNRYSHYSNLYL